MKPKDKNSINESELNLKFKNHENKIFHLYFTYVQRT